MIAANRYLVTTACARRFIVTADSPAAAGCHVAEPFGKPEDRDYGEALPVSAVEVLWQSSGRPAPAPEQVPIADYNLTDYVKSIFRRKNWSTE